MKIQLIADGFSKWHRFTRRWGISFLLGEDILFDTFGDESYFLKNVNKYNIDLSKIRYIFLSHDDWDHIAGLWYIISRYKNLSVYVVPHCHPEIKAMIQSYKVRMIEVKKGFVTDCVFTTGELKGISKDRVIYEQSLVLKTSDGLSLICGCAHTRVEDIVQSVKEQFQENVNYLIGGFHLKDNSKKNNHSIVERLYKAGVHHVVPLHCTGKQAKNIFYDIFKEGCVHLKEGESIEL